MCNERPKQICVTISNTNEKLFLEKGESFFHMLIKAGYFDTTHCGGKGVCGRCKVEFVKNPPPPTPSERKLISPEELRRGVRLACRTKLASDCELCLIEPVKKVLTVLDEIYGAFDIRNKKTHDMKENNTEVDALKQQIYVDLGTTTIVMLLLNNDGNIIDVYQTINPQRKYGADVISRIQAALEGEASELAKLVREEIKKGIAALGGNPKTLWIAGNTTMCYLLTNQDVTGLSREPFETCGQDLYVIKADDMFGIDTVIFPNITAFVGADIYVGIAACQRLLEKSKKDNAVKEKRTGLFIDLGTNGEMALIGPEKIYVASTACGPAFEGGASAECFGTDMIALMADLYTSGMIDQFGTLQEKYLKTGVTIKGIHITQQEIRQLQLAKAAIRAGIETLLNTAKVREEEVETIYLAGGFGYYLDVKKAVLIGLLPESFAKKTIAVGNTVLPGAYLVSKELAITEQEFEHTGYLAKEGVTKKISMMKEVNLAKDPFFQEKYIEYINFHL